MVCTVFTDGSCMTRIKLFTGQKIKCTGIGVFFGDNKTNISSPMTSGSQDINTAEIAAVIIAIEQCLSDGQAVIRVNTDCKNLVVMHSNFEYYYKNGWKSKRGVKLANHKQLIRLHKLIQGVTVEIKHVKAHSGIYGNEEADRLAKQGANRHPLAQITAKARRTLQELWNATPISASPSSPRPLNLETQSSRYRDSRISYLHIRAISVSKEYRGIKRLAVKESTRLSSRRTLEPHWRRASEQLLTSGDNELGSNMNATPQPNIVINPGAQNSDSKSGDHGNPEVPFEFPCDHFPF